MRLFISLQSPHQWITINNRGQALDSGVIEKPADLRMPGSAEQVIGVAPGELVSCHSVQIPGRKRTNAESALAYALEDRLSDEIDRLHFSLLSWTPNGTAWAAVVSRTQLEQWIRTFRSGGIDLDLIVADYMLLPQHPRAAITISGKNEGRIFVRDGEFSGLVLDAEGFDYWWNAADLNGQSCSVTDLDFAKSLRSRIHQQTPESGTPVSEQNPPEISHWDIGNDFTRWLVSSTFRKDYSEFNLLTGTYSPTHNNRSASILKLAVVVLLAGIVINLGMMIYETSVLESRLTDQKLKSRELFGTYFPDQPWLDRANSQVPDLINQASQGMNGDYLFQELLDAVSRISSSQGATVDEINYRDDSMVVVCRVRDLSSLDTIIQSFDALPNVNAELLSSGARDNVVTGRFRVYRRG